ncbi:hypothetical protein CTI12_AA485780 [Artemisia annua]|uniref:Helitron helicase-like domain-containing protein n=1 Tax=Artemisia annua TaxID=35608 RepID=A0A2U1LJ46_ARTAN|nr:hypothetical protein CTI12_AA485780 [Artemisia annua]
MVIDNHEKLHAWLLTILSKRRSDTDGENMNDLTIRRPGRRVEQRPDGESMIDLTIRRPGRRVEQQADKSYTDGESMIDLTIRRPGRRVEQQADGGDMPDLYIRRPGRKLVQQIGTIDWTHNFLSNLQKRKPGKQAMDHSSHTLQVNEMLPRPRGRPRNDPTKKQKIFKSDIHSSKRKSERLKQKNKMSRLKISQDGFVRPAWMGDENDPRTNAYVGISNDYIDHGNPVFKCGDCNALLWHSESMIGSTHSGDGSYSLCCGRGKVMLTNEIVNPPPLLLSLITGNNPKSKSDESTSTSETNVLDHELTIELRDMLDSINPLVAQFRMAGEQFVSAKNWSKFKLRLIEDCKVSSTSGTCSSGAIEIGGDGGLGKLDGGGCNNQNTR